MKTAEQIAAEVIEKNYGAGSEWAEPNGFGEAGFTRAQAESDITADELAGLIADAIEADRAQRKVTFIQVDTLLAAYDAYEGDDEAGFIQEWTNRLNGEDA